VLGGILSDADAYRYLPRSAAYLPDEPALRRLFVDAGFSTVGRRLLHGGLSQLLTATRTGLPAGSDARASQVAW
jgi:demethylmenaquinone methyltransferase/2-methoxy-6-polyprenyl-1,4-benzoquinol methylase